MYLCFKVVGQGFFVLFGDSTVWLHDRARRTFLCVVRFRVKAHRFVVRIRASIFRFFKVVTPVPERSHCIFFFHFQDGSLCNLMFVPNCQLMNVRWLVRRFVSTYKDFNRHVFRFVINVINVSRRSYSFRTSVSSFPCSFLIIMFVPFIACTRVFPVRLFPWPTRD